MAGKFGGEFILADCLTSAQFLTSLFPSWKAILKRPQDWIMAIEPQKRVSGSPLDNFLPKSLLHWPFRKTFRSLNVSKLLLLPEDLQLVKNSHKPQTLTVRMTLTWAASFSEVYKSLYNGYSVLRQIDCLFDSYICFAVTTYHCMPS